MNLSAAKIGKWLSSFILCIFLLYYCADIYLPVSVIIEKQINFFPKSAAEKLLEMNATKKFIVVTTVSSPSESIKNLAARKEWTLVVVADTKTPLNWSSPNVHFLSLEVQRELGYHILTKTPYKSYTRKMIGYLYAIQRGAEWIYDTDDDNKPYGKGLEQFDFGNTMSGIVYNEDDHKTKNSTSNKRLPIFQPYAFFGRPDIWPCGFPFQFISNHKNNPAQFSLCKKVKVPLIQQGLVKKDPDVDAVYRLLHGTDAGLNEEFNKHTPPIVLGTGIFAPFNSQNTLFNRKAFFTLWLPTTVAFRVTDIWRGYFAQRLLHLIDGNIGFYPVNAVQYRNNHSYMEDFKDERQVYEQSGKLVQFLQYWKCKQNETAACAEELAENMVKEGFWGQDDAILARLWNEDLRRLGYSFPEKVSVVSKYSPERDDAVVRPNCRRIYFETKFKANNSVQMLNEVDEAWKNYEEIIAFCDFNVTEHPVCYRHEAVNHLLKLRESPLFRSYRKMVLVITGNVGFGPQISFLQRMYSTFFPVTIFCGPFYEDKLNGESFPKVLEPINYIHVSQSEWKNGYFGYYCTAKVLELHIQNIDGYLVFSDDALFNIWNNFTIGTFTISANNNK